MQNLSLQEKTELAQALGLQQVLSSPDQLPLNPGEVDILISRTRNTPLTSTCLVENPIHEILQHRLQYDNVDDRKRKLEDDEIEQLLCEDDDVDETEEDFTQQSGNLKRKETSPPSSPIFRKSKFSRAAKEKLLLGGKDEKDEQEQRGSSKKFEQFVNAGEGELSTGVNISSEQVGNSKLILPPIVFTWSGWEEKGVGAVAPKFGF